MNHQLAQHLAAYGRGPDTMLVHMAPTEVAGLHALAKAYGGEITTNPQTGLPEAGFLSSIIPMLAGAFLGPAGMGLTSALGSAGVVGGITALTSGSLSKGLMAGLGAYGGAGLGESLMGTGAAGAMSEGATAGALNALSDANMPQYAGMTSGATAPAASAISGTAPAAATAFPDPYGAAASATSAATPAAQVAQASQTAPVDMMPQTSTPMPKLPAGPPDYLAGDAGGMPTQNAWDRLVSGVGKAADDPMAFLKDNKWQNAKYLGAAMAPMMAGQQQSFNPPQASPGNIKRFHYSANPQNPGPLTGSSERRWFDPQLQFISSTPATAMAGGGAVGYADGGNVNQFNTMTGDSLAAYNYLMGRGPAPSFAAAQPVQAPMIRTNPHATGQDTTPPSGPNADLIGAGANAGGGAPGTGNLGLSGLLGNMGQPAAPVTSLDSFSIDAINEAQDQASMDAANSVGSDGEGAPGNDGTSSAFADGGGIQALRQSQQSTLGSYSDGGSLLRGPGDGVSDSIPASINGDQPAALADGEFVVPARFVSELGNGSTEAGARKLYAMMDRIQARRAKTMGDNYAVDSKASAELPA